LNELLLPGQIILLFLAKLLIKGKTPTDIIRTLVSKPGLKISELFLLLKKKMVNECLRKIYDEDIIPAKKIIVLMILSKLSKLLDHFL